MVGALGLLPVGDGPLEQRDRFFQPAGRQVGVGQAAARGQRVRVAGPQGPPPVGQGPLVLADRLFQPARLLIGPGQVAAGGEGVRVVGAQHPFLVGQRPLEHGDRVVQPSGLLVGVRQVAVGGQGLRVAGAQQVFPVGQGPLVQADGLVQAARRILRGREVITDEERLGVRRAQQPGAGHHHVPPVRDGRAAQPGGVQALAGPDQHPVAVRRPEQFCCGFVQQRGAVPERLGQQRVAGIPLRPGFEQRVGGGADRPVVLGGGQVLQDQGLDHRVDQDSTGRAGRIDGQQAQPVQVVHGVPHLSLVGGRGDMPGDVAARGVADQHHAGDATRVHHRGQHQGR